MRAFSTFIVLCLGLVAIPRSACAQCSLHWQQLNPAQVPPGPFRGHHAMAYDSKRRVTVLYGGAHLDSFRTYSEDDILGETWEFDGLTWQQKFPPTQPLKLADHAMSYDPVTGMVVMFGGYAGTNAFILSGSTYEYDGNDWRLVNVPHPVARAKHRMTYDAVRGVHVMVGGYRPGTGYLRETFEYDSRTKTWTLRSTNGPSARSDFGLAYDSVRNQTILFGGRLADATSFTDHANDTWVWDGEQAAWTELTPAHRPVGRSGHGMAFDKTRGVAVVLGGEVINVIEGAPFQVSTNETWEWNGSDWVDRSLTYDFCCRALPSDMVYETARQQMLIFDLFSGPIANPDKTYVLATGNGNFLNYVDWSNFSGEDGSLSFPYRTLGHALPCTLGAGTISIRGGNYPGGSTFINKQVQIIANNGPAHMH